MCRRWDSTAYVFSGKLVTDSNVAERERKGNNDRMTHIYRRPISHNALSYPYAIPEKTSRTVS